jgi:dUTPase
MNSKKLKGVVSTRLPKKVSMAVELMVAPDSSEFMPILRDDGGFDLFANPPKDVHGVERHMITSRVIQQIDCGISVVIPENCRLILEPQPEHISKGLIIQSGIVGEGKQRVVFFAHNLGKEILVFNKGDKIARLYLTNNYKVSLRKE